MVNIYAFILSLVLSQQSLAQSKWSFEHYNYIHQPDAAVFVPMVHFDTKDSWHGELRYNYEDARTLTLLAGKTFTAGKNNNYSITPKIGYSTGDFTGITFAINKEAEWNNFYLAAESQYSVATNNTADFFFNWSELGYSISNRLFAGVAVQYTRQARENDFEPGLLAGLSFANVSIPFYVFSPFHTSRYFVLGLNYEYNTKKKRQ